jgi:hypothetical protein
LPSNFDRNIVEIKEAKLKEGIVNNKEITKETQTKTLDFLTKAKNLLIDTIKQKSESLEKKLDKFFNATNVLKPTEIENLDEHMVQVRGVKPYSTVSVPDYFTGIMNPIKKKTTRKNLS